MWFKLRLDNIGKGGLVENYWLRSAQSEFQRSIYGCYGVDSVTYSYFFYHDNVNQVSPVCII